MVWADFRLDSRCSSGFDRLFKPDRFSRNGTSAKCRVCSCEFPLGRSIRFYGLLIGALIHLLRTSKNKAAPELRAVVSEDARPEVEKILFDVGALNVLITGGSKHS